MQQFCDAIASRDLDAVGALFTDDIIFRSPVVDTPYERRAQVGTLLRAVGNVLEDFRYTRLIGAPDAADHVLVFGARIGNRDVEGCDFIHVNDKGLIDELYVMFRPLSGVPALAEAMKRELELAEDAAAS